MKFSPVSSFRMKTSLQQVSIATAAWATKCIKTLHLAALVAEPAGRIRNTATTKDMKPRQ